MEQKEAIYFHSENVENVASPQEIVPVLVEMFHPRSVVDLGCGIGTFLYCFKQQGVTDVLGVDGDWVNRELLHKYIAPGEFQAHNLEKPLVLSKKYDLAICVEVAEHLNEEAADILIESLSKASDTLIFSAAVSNQGGQNHINEQPLSYWMEKFLRKGFIFYDVLRPLFWNNPRIAWWYKQNIFVVSSRELNIVLPGERSGINAPILEYIHPELLGLKTVQKEKMQDDLDRQSMQLQSTHFLLASNSILLKKVLEESEKRAFDLAKTESILEKMTESMERQSRLLEEALEVSKEMEQKKAAIHRLEAELSHHAQELRNARQELTDQRQVLHDIYTGHGGIKNYVKYGIKGVLHKVKVAPGKLAAMAGKGGAGSDNWHTLIQDSGLFDTAYYEQQLAARNIKVKDPVAHYLQKGDSQFNPHPFFHSKWYLQTYPDVRKSGQNPLVHYILRGQVEGRFPNPLFDTIWYLQTNPEVRDISPNPLSHFINHGLHEGRSPNMVFDSKWIYHHYRRNKGEKLIAAWMEDPNKEIKQFNFFFDLVWFRKKYGLTNLSSAEAIFYFIRNAKEKQLNTSELFDMRYYLKHNPDVAASGIHPFDHFMKYGMFEGRVAWNNGTVIGFQRDFTQNPEKGEALIAESRKTALVHTVRPAPGSKIGVYTNTQGNYFFAQIRDLICAGLLSAGYTPVILNEKSERPDDLELDIFIAPHEFFILGEGVEWADHPILASSVILNTEQWQTRWFLKSLPCLFHAGAIWDLNIQSAAGLCKLGMHAEFLPLGFDAHFTQLSAKGALPTLRALETLNTKAREYRPSGDDRFTDRPLDFFFVGSRSPHRAKFFSRAAPTLQQFDGFLHFSDSSVPLVPGDPLYINDSDAIIGLCQRSKILLNIHQSEVPYFEWQRIVFQGFWQKTVVVSEPCFHAPGFKPGVHYIEAELDDIPGIIQWLLTTAEGREKAEELRKNAYEQLINRFDMSKVLRELLT